jgi:AcrR family transcriptional regulator
MTQDVEPISRREQAKGGRRARIVEATYALLREVGVSDLSVKMIADQAGVSPATVYNLFGTKGAVLEKVYERDKAEFERRIVETASADSLARIFDCLSISASLYRADPRFYRSIMAMPNASVAGADHADQVFLLRAKFWRHMVRAATAEGHLTADTDAAQVGALLTHLASGALGFWVSNLISIEQFEAETIHGFAALLWSFATPAAQPRLRRIMDAVPAALAAEPSRVDAGHLRLHGN